MHKKIFSILATLVVFGGLIYWIWTLSIPVYIKIALSLGSIGVRFILGGLIDTKSVPVASTADYAVARPDNSFSFAPWFLFPLARVWGWAVKGAFFVAVILIVDFVWNRTSVATAFVPEQRMWQTGFVNHEGEEEWKLLITKEMDYKFMLPACAKRRTCNPHRVQKYYPNARSTGNPDAIEREVLYTDDEVSKGIGAYVYHGDGTSYMNHFYMSLDPSVTGISRDTVTVWMKHKHPPGMHTYAAH